MNKTLHHVTGYLIKASKGVLKVTMIACLLGAASAAFADCTRANNLIAAHQRATDVQGGMVYDTSTGELKTCDGSNYSLLLTTVDTTTSGTTKVTANTGGTISFTTGGVTTGYFDTAGRLIAPGISATTNRTSVTTLYASGRVGVGVTAPSTQLEVSGTISATALTVNGASIAAAPMPYLTVVTSGVTWTSNANSKYAKVTVLGGGGAGGGSAGSGGGAGGMATRLYTTTPSTAYTIAIGAAGTAASGSGNAGGNTTFTDGVTLITGNGGAGGDGGVTYTGGDGGNATNGTINTKGARGAFSITGRGGDGASTLYGAGGRGTNTSGYNASGYGAGGGGSVYTFGGVGAPGVIIIEEWY